MIEELGKVRELLASDRGVRDWETARSRLKEWEQRLSLHLTQEDQLLYPRLRASDDAMIRWIVEDFLQEVSPQTERIHHILERLNNYGSRLAPGELDQVRGVLEGLTTALANRVEMEESVIFPLLEPH